MTQYIPTPDEPVSVLRLRRRQPVAVHADPDKLDVALWDADSRPVRLWCAGQDRWCRIRPDDVLDIVPAERLAGIELVAAA